MSKCISIVLSYEKTIHKHDNESYIIHTILQLR